MRPDDQATSWDFFFSSSLVFDVSICTMHISAGAWHRSPVAVDDLFLLPLWRPCRCVFQHLLRLATHDDSKFLGPPSCTEDRSPNGHAGGDVKTCCRCGSPTTVLPASSDPPVHFALCPPPLHGDMKWGDGRQGHLRYWGYSGILMLLFTRRITRTKTAAESNDDGNGNGAHDELMRLTTFP
jgi:hypothetical protein